MINVRKTVAHASEFNTKSLEVKIFLRILNPNFVTEASLSLLASLITNDRWVEV